MGMWCLILLLRTATSDGSDFYAEDQSISIQRVNEVWKEVFRIVKFMWWPVVTMSNTSRDELSVKRQFSM